VAQDLAQPRGEVGAGAFEFGRGHADEGDVRAFGRIARTVDERLGEETVRGEEEDIIGRHEGAHVEQYLRGVVLHRSPDVDEIWPQVRNLRHQSLVIRRSWVVTLRAKHLYSHLLERGGEHIGDAVPVEALIVKDIRRTHALGFDRPGRAGCPLDVVRSANATVIARAAGIVDFRLAFLVTSVLLCQAGVGVGEGDHHHAGLVHDRDRDLGRTRVVRSHVGHAVRIGDGLVGICRLDTRIPPAVVRGDARIKRHVFEREATGHVAQVGEGQLGRLQRVDANSFHGSSRWPGRIDLDETLVGPFDVRDVRIADRGRTAVLRHHPLDLGQRRGDRRDAHPEGDGAHDERASVDLAASELIEQIIESLAHPWSSVLVTGNSAGRRAMPPCAGVASPRSLGSRAVNARADRPRPGTTF
jgi:hypothetical protein